MALEKLEMHDIQDKTRLMDEMNETRDGVNKALAAVKRLDRNLGGLNDEVEAFAEKLDVHLKSHEVAKGTKVKK